MDRKILRDTSFSLNYKGLDRRLTSFKNLELWLENGFHTLRIGLKIFEIRFWYGAVIFMMLHRALKKMDSIETAKEFFFKSLKKC